MKRQHAAAAAVDRDQHGSGHHDHTGEHIKSRSGAHLSCPHRAQRSAAPAREARPIRLHLGGIGLKILCLEVRLPAQMPTGTCPGIPKFLLNPTNPWKMSDTLDPLARSVRMSRIRHKDTKPEWWFARPYGRQDSDIACMARAWQASRTWFSTRYVPLCSSTDATDTHIRARKGVFPSRTADSGRKSSSATRNATSGTPGDSAGKDGVS